MAASKLLPLVRGTVLYRVYTRRAGEPDRALSFYRDSHGRASPVLDASGKKDPALYAAVDTAQGATLEMLYHTVLKKFRKGAVLPRSIFKDLRLVKIAVKQTLKLVSIEALQAAGDVAPPVFSLPRADYSDTQAVAQALYSRYRTASGLCWHSAQGPAN